MEVDPTRMCELLVGLPDVVVLSVDDVEDGPLVIHVEQAGPRPSCVGCGQLPQVKDREVVELVDLPCFGRRNRLRWRKVRFWCRNSDCEMISWTWDDTRIGFPPPGAVGSSRPVGHRPGGPLRPDSLGGGLRAGLRLAHDQRRGRLLRRGAHRR